MKLGSWFGSLGAFGDLEGKIATPDVWKVLKLSLTANDG